MADIPESTKLLPCPFCGGKPTAYEGRYTSSVKCDNGHAMHEYKPTLVEAIAAWNTRAAPPAMDREAVERVREAAYRQALEDVCNPLGYLQRMADAEGAKLSGMAYAIASDIGTIQRIAKEALSTLSADAIRQGEGWRLVPVELTQDMLEAVVQLDWKATHDPLWPEYWAALIAAAPKPATPASHASDGGKA